ncbi:MAG: hypothetical protein ACLFPQ_04785 [Candidatus Woesearchaeota archaeon]
MTDRYRLPPKSIDQIAKELDNRPLRTLLNNTRLEVERYSGQHIHRKGNYLSVMDSGMNLIDMGEIVAETFGDLKTENKTHYDDYLKKFHYIYNKMKIIL